MAMSLFSSHVERWRDCEGCSLSSRRSRVVLYRGKIPCDVLLVGEAPGDSEDVVGVPFVGPAGRLLDAMIAESFGRITFCPVCRKTGRFEKQYTDGSQFECDQWHKTGEGDVLRVGFTNLVGCIPRGEDGAKIGEPEDEAIRACSDRLREIVGVAKPKLIVQVGRLAETWLTPGFKTSITLPVPVRFVKITHPAAILRARIDQQGFARQQAVVAMRNAVADLNEPPPVPLQSEKRVKSKPGRTNDPPF